jgi:allophanate hydrolase subunit 1
MKKVLPIILLAIAGSFGTANSQQTTVVSNDTSGWYKIGEAKVDFKKDRDEILVLGADKFKSIKLKVINAPIELKDLEIYFETGKKQDVKINKSLKAAGETSVIDLEDGEKRSLKKIDFIYKTVPNNMDVKAVVEVWGLKTKVNKM